MENRYYAPEIEEFHQGFEYEFNYNNTDWKKCTFCIGSGDIDEMEGTFYDFSPNNPKTECRVKYLDKEDIESLGWVQEPVDGKFSKMYHLKTPIYKLISRGTFLLAVKPYCQKVIIKTPNFYRDGTGNFDGYITKANELIIKNKSELKRLMGQLNIL